MSFSGELPLKRFCRAATGQRWEWGRRLRLNFALFPPFFPRLVFLSLSLSSSCKNRKDAGGDPCLPRRRRRFLMHARGRPAPPRPRAAVVESYTASQPAARGRARQSAKRVTATPPHACCCHLAVGLCLLQLLEKEGSCLFYRAPGASAQADRQGSRVATACASTSLSGSVYYACLVLGSHFGAAPRLGCWCRAHSDLVVSYADSLLY